MSQQSARIVTYCTGYWREYQYVILFEYLNPDSSRILRVRMTCTCTQVEVHTSRVVQHVGPGRGALGVFDTPVDRQVLHAAAAYSLQHSGGGGGVRALYCHTANSRSDSQDGAQGLATHLRRGRREGPEEA